jgi:predicted nucleotidyltransferase
METIEKLRNLCREFYPVALYAFGSRAGQAAEFIRKGRALGQGTSDLDLGVLGRPGRRLDIRDKVRLAIRLEELFQVPAVDVVVLQEAEPYLALAIIRGELLVALDADFTAEYELFVLRRAADLLPFERERRRLILHGGAR